LQKKKFWYPEKPKGIDYIVEV